MNTIIGTLTIHTIDLTIVHVDHVVMREDGRKGIGETVDRKTLLHLLSLFLSYSYIDIIPRHLEHSREIQEFLCQEILTKLFAIS
jgi:hypothetical protein